MDISSIVWDTPHLTHEVADRNSRSGMKKALSVCGHLGLLCLLRRVKRDYGSCFCWSARLAQNLQPRGEGLSQILVCLNHGGGFGVTSRQIILQLSCDLAHVRLLGNVHVVAMDFLHLQLPQNNLVPSVSRTQVEGKGIRLRHSAKEHRISCIRLSFIRLEQLAQEFCLRQFWFLCSALVREATAVTHLHQFRPSSFRQLQFLAKLRE